MSHRSMDLRFLRYIVAYVSTIPLFFLDIDLQMMNCHCDRLSLCPSFNHVCIYCHSHVSNVILGYCLFGITNSVTVIRIQ